MLGPKAIGTVVHHDRVLEIGCAPFEADTVVEAVPDLEVADLGAGAHAEELDGVGVALARILDADIAQRARALGQPVAPVGKAVLEHDGGLVSRGLAIDKDARPVAPGRVARQAAGTGKDDGRILGTLGDEAAALRDGKPGVPLVGIGLHQDGRTGLDGEGAVFLHRDQAFHQVGVGGHQGQVTVDAALDHLDGLAGHGPIGHGERRPYLDHKGKGLGDGPSLIGQVEFEADQGAIGQVFYRVRQVVLGDERTRGKNLGVKGRPLLDHAQLGQAIDAAQLKTQPHGQATVLPEGLHRHQGPDFGAFFLKNVGISLAAQQQAYR